MSTKFKVRVLKLVIVAVSLLLCVSVASWVVSDPYVTVVDVRKSETVFVHKAPIQRNVYAISIRCAGHIEGEAIVTFMMGGEPYQTHRVAGNVNIQFGGDWYSDSAEVRYEPVNAQAGSLVVYYRFFDLS